MSGFNGHEFIANDDDMIVCRLCGKLLDDFDYSDKGCPKVEVSV